MINNYAIFRNCDDAAEAIQRRMYDKNGMCFILEGVVRKVYGLRITKIASGEQVCFYNSSILNLTGQFESSDVDFENCKLAIVDPNIEYSEEVRKQLSKVPLVITNASPLCAKVTVAYNIDERGKTIADMHTKDYQPYSDDSALIGKINTVEELSKPYASALPKPIVSKSILPSKIAVIEEKINASVDLPKPNNGDSEL